jgi:hypothetical protein
MNFKYYKDAKGEVFAYDIDDETQLPYMQEKIDQGCTDITDTWTPQPPTVFEDPKPTKEELLAQIKELTEKINALGS